MVNFEFVMSLLPAWVLVPFLFMVISGLLSAFRTAEGELRQSAAASLYRYLCQQAPIAPICFKNGSVLTQYGRVEGLSPVYGNIFSQLDSWTIQE